MGGFELHRLLVDRVTRFAATANPAPIRVSVRVVNLPIYMRGGWLEVGAQVDVELVMAGDMLARGHAELVNERDAVHILRAMVGLPAPNRSNPTRKTP